MASLKTGTLPALRRQNLLAEFAGLKQACPEGVFVSLTPGDPTLWSGVIFVRKGPYATAILRFQISFPDAYPDLPPLVTFSTEMFHPLITDLTTYTYTTDIQDNGTVSATDEERLPPGGFSLRHGFPAWFGRGRRARAASGRQQPNPPAAAAQTPPRPARGGSLSSATTPGSSGASPQGATATPGFMQTRRTAVSTYDVLRYIRSTFDSEDVLDSIPLEAAGDPGAWYAWRAHRRSLGKLPRDADAAPQPAGPEGVGGGGGGGGGGGDGASARDPGQWNWDHVWEQRVKKRIAASVSEPVLYGGAGASDDVIRFLSVEDADVEAMKDNIKRTMDISA